MAGAFLLWLVAIGVGFNVLLHYSNTPGRWASPASKWPSTASIHREPQRATLVLFAHPQCPCSRATIGELAQILAHNQGKVSAYVYFYAPRAEGSGWARTQLWRDALAIPGVHAMEDRDGREARRFGAATSGQTLLYDSEGELTFNGGIAASRGHSGENDGRDAVVSLLASGKAEHQTTPIFGCSLLVAD
jgi:hypothetical protein